MTRMITRPALGLLLALFTALVAAVVLPAGAASATAYRYWGFYELHGTTWSYASKGPAQVKPADGTVEGWRYAVGDGKSPRMPRATATFDQLCHSTAAKAGQKRVGVVIDYGRSADGDGSTRPPAPVGRCATVDKQATAADVLGAVGNVRVAKGLVCGINSYPATGCGGAVKNVSAATKAKDGKVRLQLGPAAAPQSAEGGGSTGTWIGIGVVAALVIALGGLVLARRRVA